MNEAFVYKWTNSTNGMIYVGYHKGDPSDGYVCSSKYFLAEYKQDPSIFTREILAYGTTREMVDLETKILKENDAGKNPEFYNKHCNNGQYVVSHTEETKAKMSASHMGKMRSDEFRENRRQYMLTNNPYKGKKHSEETRAKMRKPKSITHGTTVKYKGKVYAQKKHLAQDTGLSQYLISKLIKDGKVEIVYGD